MQVKIKQLGGHYAHVLHREALNLKLFRAVNELLTKADPPATGATDLFAERDDLWRDKEQYFVFSRRLAECKFNLVGILFDELQLTTDQLNVIKITALVCFGNNHPGRDDAEYGHWEREQEISITVEGTDTAILIRRLATYVVAYLLRFEKPYDDVNPQ